ncbi:MAG TPA: hypothetical protein PLO53_10905, partial [Candidatus Hydrogenedentes bacterium]|nr:hypothetical protein [Candidatus Hydrogenedentota bacterium]
MVNDVIRDLPVICGLFPEEISALLEVEPLRGRQIFAWIHRRRQASFDGMTDLPAALRETLKSRARIWNAECVEAVRSE